MKKQFLMTLILTCIVVGLSTSGVIAQGSLSGDSVCGSSSSTICTLEHGKTIAKNFVTSIIQIGSAVLVVFIVYRFITAWFALQAGNANAYKIAAGQVGNAILGFVVIVAVVGGFFLAVLQFLSTQDWATQFIKLFSESVIPHAYAVEGRLLPNPLGTNNLYDFILLFVRLVVRWFVFPALIVMWVWSGFAYVLAQGNPEKISNAHKWLLWAVISTVVVLVTEGFLFALRGTVQQILS